MLVYMANKLEKLRFVNFVFKICEYANSITLGVPKLEL